MQNPLAHVPEEKAQKELVRFLIIGWIAAVVAFAVFGWAFIVALGCASRCLILSWHTGNKERSKAWLYKLASILLLIVSIYELYLVVHQP
ncbi:MAG TPA: hypothetical protein VMT30_04395 [Candidatus Saccharimonadia bacterium]|nr:hypothetical protein [Candidatus Saccharimonadia bacterium]